MWLQVVMETIPEGGLSLSEHDDLSRTLSKILNSDASCDYNWGKAWLWVNVKGSSKLALTHLGLSVTSCAFPSQHRFSVKDRNDRLQAQLGLSVHPQVRVWASISEQSTAKCEMFGQTAWLAPTPSLPLPTHPQNCTRGSLAPGYTCLGFPEACALTALFKADVLVNFVDFLIPVVTRKLWNQMPGERHLFHLGCTASIWTEAEPTIFLIHFTYTGGVRKV